jgi:dienelactone hydrolase
MKKFVRTMTTAALVIAGLVSGTLWGLEAGAAVRPEVKFDPKIYEVVPEVYPADGISADGVRALFFAGPDWKGKPTRVFAWYGVPKVEPGKRVPAMVLIHGGGGTAFDSWVRLWNSRGYAAIAMDVCGCVPVGTYGNWQRHENGGPPGWDASFGQLDDAVTDQWTYHAVNAACLAHSLVRSFPEVDAERTGVTGISWGGYLTCIVAGVDDRFRLAVPVYGCGFLGENSVWLPAFERLGREKAELWLKQWDPSEYLPRAKSPMLWVNGTNDFAYPMDSWQRSSELPELEPELCLRVRMPHGHGPAGENPEEIRVFADSLLQGGLPLPRMISQTLRGRNLTATFESKVPVIRAELCFTKAAGRWQDREWLTSPAELRLDRGEVGAAIPEDAVVAYLNLFDDRGCVVSSRHVELKPAAAGN